ncbi:MAG: nickel pincer cofactor biosynthesis protein LarC [Planctomycetes bacterium]|nr:nickel pincer cofactor biosynthesis protein LarC [Planctomycetota bacterium]
MLLGALLAVGVEPGALSAELGRLGLEGWRLEVSRVHRGPVQAVHVDVVVGGAGPGALPPSPHLAEVEAILDASALRSPVRERARCVFRRLAAAEATVHGVGVEEVHFHEVGALDAIIDVVGTVAGFALLGVEELFASPVPLGRGTVGTAHGPLPVPAPATAELLRGFPVEAGPCEGELTTPTGAALLTTLASAFGPIPAMTLRAVGYGAGSAERDFPNVVRLLVGDAPEPAPAAAGVDRVRVLEFAVDDATGQALGHLLERCLEAGALDVYATGVTMKKSRPGVHVTILAPEDRADAVARVVFRETSTLGLRERWEVRRILERETVAVATPYGEVRLKLGRLTGETVTASPEYEDCRRLAAAAGVPLKEVQAAASEAWRARSGS